MLKVFPLIILAMLFNGCSKESDSGYMKKAEDELKKNNISEAVLSYENLIKEYPESPLAPQALSKLASLYQNKLVKGIDSPKSLSRAAELYREIFDKYPDSKEAPEGLFMSGFILANELSSYNEATATYNLFLENFPDHKLAPAAKDELENMGLSPEQILQKKITSGK
ncbi:MAG: tetratricopeptide repeat protein [Ignavibacteriaceae bacterium]|nr:tetratricopeptide repeat protein [Ignavibacteriaceae bacterium]